MRVVVVQAHPLVDSCSGELRRRVCAGMDAADVEYRVFRLCEGERPGAADLEGVTSLVLVYPTWWGGQPAVLLDWLQETLEHPGALRSVQRLTAVTTMGSSRFVNRVQGEWGRSFLEGRMLDACAPDATIDWVGLYKIDRRSPDEIRAFLDRVEERFATSAPAPA